MKIKKVLLLVGFICLLTGCSNNNLVQDTSTEISVSENTQKEYTYTGECEAINISEDDDVKIILDNVEISSENVPPIYVDAKSVTIELVGENTLSDSNSRDDDDLKSVIYCNGDITFTGDGTLNLNANYKHGIVADNVFVNSGTYNIVSLDDCIHTNASLEINGGEFNLESQEDECLQSENQIIINNGTISGSSSGDFIKAESLLEVNGGSINCKDCVEGLESKDLLTINDGDIYIRGTDDCINASNSIVINGGNINAISSTNDAIDSNGTIEINGGDIYAIALTMPEEALDCDDNKITITGGNIVGLGTNNSEYEDSDDHTISISVDKETIINNLVLLDENGDEVFSYSFEDYSDFVSTQKDFGINNPQNDSDIHSNTDDMPPMPNDEENRNNEQQEKFDENKPVNNQINANANNLIIRNENIDSDTTYQVLINGELQESNNQ